MSKGRYTFAGIHVRDLSRCLRDALRVSHQRSHSLTLYGLRKEGDVWAFDKHGITEETATLVHGLREKAEEFRKSGGEIPYSR